MYNPIFNSLVCGAWSYSNELLQYTIASALSSQGFFRGGGGGGGGGRGGRLLDFGLPHLAYAENSILHVNQ